MNKKEMNMINKIFIKIVIINIIILVNFIKMEMVSSKNIMNNTVTLLKIVNNPILINILMEVIFMSLFMKSWIKMGIKTNSTVIFFQIQNLLILKINLLSFHNKNKKKTPKIIKRVKIVKQWILKNFLNFLMILKKLILNMKKKDRSKKWQKGMILIVL